MNKTIFAAVAAVAMLFGANISAQAQHMDQMASHVMVGDLELSGAFTRAMPPSAPAGGGFLTITNNGSEDDRLVAASAPNAERVEIHEMVMDGDVMKMGEVAGGLVIPAGESVDLKPGGYHIMFMQITDPFVEGETVPVTLTFEKAGEIEIEMQVAPIGASSMPMSHDHG